MTACWKSEQREEPCRSLSAEQVAESKVQSHKLKRKKKSLGAVQPQNLQLGLGGLLWDSMHQSHSRHTLAGCSAPQKPIPLVCCTGFIYFTECPPATHVCQQPAPEELLQGFEVLVLFCLWDRLLGYNNSLVKNSWEIIWIVLLLLVIRS